MNLHNLLVVVDPSSDEQPALTRAQWIAERSGASVELLLCDFNPALDGGLFFDSHSLQRARDLYLDERVTWLEQLSMPLQQAGIRTQVEAQWGKPLDRMDPATGRRNPARPGPQEHPQAQPAAPPATG